MQHASFDVAVVGGGPAGVSTAQQLARRGCTVALLERSDFTRRRVGETLTPAMATVLAPLGVSPAFRAGGHLRCVGMRCRWGGEEPYQRSFVFSPYGHGWHIDRLRFDRMLFDAAAASGVHALTGAAIRSVERAGAQWRIALDARGARLLTARFLVDATGHCARLARRFGARRASRHPTLATIAWFAAAQDGPMPAVTQIETDENGWWYLAPLPNDEFVVVRFTTPTPGARGSRGAMLEQGAARTSLWREHAIDARLLATTACRAETSRLEPVSGPGWLAVGDAALTIDPLSGDGILRGIAMGAAAADAITKYLSGSHVALNGYAESVAECHRTYSVSEHDFYQRERRWEQSPFWSRRHFDRALN